MKLPPGQTQTVTFMPDKRGGIKVLMQHLLNVSELSQVDLDYPHQLSLSLGTGRRTTAIQEVISPYKASSDPDKFIRHLENILKTERCISPKRIFLNWVEAREMITRGMDIAAHTHSH